MNRLATAAILAALCWGTSFSARCSAAPNVTAAESVHDFGRANIGDRLANTFILRNSGPGPVHVLDVHADCDCITASYDKTIEAGKTGEVRVTLDTSDLDGGVERLVYVETDDATVPTIGLKVKAAVEPKLASSPGYARYVYVQKEAPGRIVQKIWALDGADFKVLDVKSPYPFLAATFHEATPDERQPEAKGRQWIVESVLSPDAPVGTLAGWIVVTTDHPKQKHVNFAVTGFVRPVLAVTPPSLDLGARSLAQPEMGSFRVQIFATEEIAVTSVDSDIKGFKLELEPQQPGRTYKIHLSLTPELAKGDFHGVIRVHTASAKAPLVEVPVSGRLE